MADDTQAPQLPTPDPALRRLDRFVGSWTMRGHLVGSDEIVVSGETSFRWLPGGFFLLQEGNLNFIGMEISNHELIGYDPEIGTFPSTVYSNLSPTPLPYRWEVEGDRLKISVSYAPLDATFTGLVGGRRELQWRVAPQPGRGRDRERAVRHRRLPSLVT